MSILTKVMVAATALFLALASAAQETAPGQGRGPDEVQQSVARSPQAGHIFTPASSIERPEDAGVRFHTNYVLHSFDGIKPTVLKSPAPLTVHSTINPNITTTEASETPDSMGCLYVHSPNIAGCIPQYIGGPSSAGWGAIALVDAYDNPDAASDLATFDTYWGLGAANFTKVYANGNGSCTTPAPDAGWAGEESLDIEWAHVFAPKAAIILVEACSNSSADLFYAEQVAFNYVASHGGGQISNSWGGGEFAGENSNDELFSGGTTITRFPLPSLLPPAIVDAAPHTPALIPGWFPQAAPPCCAMPAPGNFIPNPAGVAPAVASAHTRRTPTRALPPPIRDRGRTINIPYLGRLAARLPTCRSTPTRLAVYGSTANTGSVAGLWWAGPVFRLRRWPAS
jgi:hypothetical protein